MSEAQVNQVNQEETAEGAATEVEVVTDVEKKADKKSANPSEDVVQADNNQSNESSPDNGNHHQPKESEEVTRDKSSEGANDSNKNTELIDVAQEAKASVATDAQDDIQQTDLNTNANQTTTTTELIGTTIEKSEADSEQTDTNNKETVTDQPKEQTATSVGTSTMPITETPEVSSTKNDNPPKSMRMSRRQSYANSGRAYSGHSYQNYGLAYLPYKSNFEPSEDARRRADEFFKTLKL